MTTKEPRMVDLKGACSMDTTGTVPVSPVPVRLFRADHDAKSDDPTISDGVGLNYAMPEENDTESPSGAIFIKLQPCILRCNPTSDLTQEPLTWELKGRDPVQDAFYYQSSDILADAKSLRAEVVKDSHLLEQDDAPQQVSWSLIPCVVSKRVTSSDTSKPLKTTDLAVGHLNQKSPTCDKATNLPENAVFSPKTQDIVDMSVRNIITDSLEKSFKDVIATAILKKSGLNGATQESIPCEPQTQTGTTSDDVNSASCEDIQANDPKDTVTDCDIETPLIQQTGQQSVSVRETLSTSSSKAAVLPIWQTQEIVTMSVQDMTDSTEATARCVESVSMESSKSPDGEVSKQLVDTECDQTTQFTITLPLENSLLWKTQETMECISKEVQEAMPMPPLPPTELGASCTSQAAIKVLVAESPREGKLTHVVPQELPFTHIRFSQQPFVTTSNSPSHQTFPQMLNSNLPLDPACPDKRRLSDVNNNLEEPPQKQICLNNSIAASLSPVLFQELSMPRLLQGPSQVLPPTLLPHSVQQGDSLPILRSKLQPSDGFSNTVPPNYSATSTNLPWFNTTRPQHVYPNINTCIPGVPISQLQPLKSSTQLSGLRSDDAQMNNSAYTWPKYPHWTQKGPRMSTHPQISGKPQMSPGFPRSLVNRPVASQPAIPQVVTNTPLLTPTDSLHFPLPDIHLPSSNSTLPTNVQPQERPISSLLPPVSYFSSLRSPKELQHHTSLASNSFGNFHKGKQRASVAVDRSQILECIRRPPPPYQAKPVLPDHQDPHTITHLSRRASTNLDQWRADRLLQPSPQMVSEPAPRRETKVDTRQAASLENYKEVSCLNCAGTVPADDRYRLLQSDVIAVVQHAIELSLPATAEKPSIIICRCCEEVLHTICGGQQALTRAKEKFIRSSSPVGYLSQKTYSALQPDFCVNCNAMMNSKAKRRLLFNQKNDKWIVANVIESEFNISLASEKKHRRKLYLCFACYKQIKQVRAAQVFMSMAMKDFNLRMSPVSQMFMFNKRFQGTSILT